MSFELDIKKFKEKVKDRSKLVLQKTALEIHKGVVVSTPVDTGRARAGWDVGINNVTPGAAANMGKTIQEIVNAGELTIKQAEADDAIFVSNNVNYIEFLENGSSEQAPNGMVKKTLRRFPQFVRKSTQESKRERP